SPKKVYCADVGIRNLVTGFRDKGAIFENLVYLKVRRQRPCYVYQDGIELDFLTGDTLVEVKYGQELSGKQKRLFDEFACNKKVVVGDVHDYLNLNLES
ncbi:MAG: ATP-binding protein, partial [Deltaproteobacteria bacterium]|nr:ATP-binding protein [Deltaproteobacteria bacterium]